MARRDLPVRPKPAVPGPRGILRAETIVELSQLLRPLTLPSPKRRGKISVSLPLLGEGGPKGAFAPEGRMRGVSSYELSVN